MFFFILVKKDIFCVPWIQLKVFIFSLDFSSVWVLLVVFVLPSQDYVTYSETSAALMDSKGFLKLNSNSDLDSHIHAHLSLR